jgi:hypothetical protein
MWGTGGHLWVLRANRGFETVESQFGRGGERVYWRVEGSLLELTTVRPIAFFTWNGQTFVERWMRRGLVLVMAVLRPFLYATNRVFATRGVHTAILNTVPTFARPLRAVVP